MGGARATAALGLLLITAGLRVTATTTGDLYWEGEAGEATDEFLEVDNDGPGLGAHLRRIRDTLWGSMWDTPSDYGDLKAEEPRETREKRQIDNDDSEFATEDTNAWKDPLDSRNEIDKDDEDFPNHLGSGDVSYPQNPNGKEMTMQVSFVVREPYRDSYSNRDSTPFQNLSRSLADAVNALYDQVSGTQRATLVRIQSRPSDKFSCKVSLDLVTTNFYEVEKLRDILYNHIKRYQKLGDLVVSDEEFLVQRTDLLDGEVVKSCTDQELRCSTGHCVPISARCNSTNECPDASDEIGCYNYDENEDIDQMPEQKPDDFGEDPIFQNPRRIDENNIDSKPVEIQPTESNPTDIYPTENSPNNRGNVCPDDTMTCDETRCILLSQRCDGTQDCRDGTDELNCAEQCAQDDFRCPSNNQCIPLNRQCDKVIDCPNGEDERDCSCVNDEFRCSDGTCIEQRKVCDGVPHCNDGSDEDNCATSDMCAARCSDGRCVPDNKVCDGVNDCFDGSDEVDCDCGTEDFRCANGDCISISQFCNGYADCIDDSDEVNCTTTEEPPTTPIDGLCRSNEFTCDDGKCINLSFRCDGQQDCTDFSDEDNCPGRPTDCLENEWRCTSGECIDYRRKCDRRQDCLDNSDENEFECREPPITEGPDTTPYYLPETTRKPWEIPTTGYTTPYSIYPQTQAPSTSRPSITIGPGYPDDRLNLHVYDVRDETQVVKEARYTDGQDVVFRCRDEGARRVPVVWSREGGRPLPANSSDKYGRLEMFKVKVSDSGSYVCSAKGYSKYEDGAEQTVRLIISPQTAAPPQSTCGIDQATCSNLECIPRSALCNGVFDCRDRSDEHSCPPHGLCEPNQFRCNNKRCVSKTWMCDSENDCYDNSDEEHCSPPPPGSICRSNEFMCASQQCVPRSFQCDGQNDCNDGSDEVGCAPVHISQPPPRFKFLLPGETMVLTCVAVGVPTPLVIWRLNWGHIPDKCSYRSDNGMGILTCPNVQAADQGAYSCEALNSQGYSAFAVPDTILTVNSTQSQDVCPSGYFNSEANEPQDCIKCFCFGASARCKSADLFMYQLPTPLGEGGTILLGLVREPSGVLNEQPINDLYYYQPNFYNGATVTKLVDSSPRDAHPYLTLPESYNGIQLTSYGGYIKYRIQPHVRRTVYSNRMPDVVIKGKYATLVHHSQLANNPSSEINLEVRLLPEYWQKTTPAGIVQATREDLMMALDNVEKILLHAEINGGGVNISDFKMDSAQQLDLGLGAANYVEECECPRGYTGLSCQKCEQGFVRESSGAWLGHCREEDQTCPAGYYGEPRRGIPCRPCPCPLTSPTNQFARTCHLGNDGQVVCDCQPGYEGSRCERCAQGLIGNPLQPGDSCREPPSSRCNPDGTAVESRGACTCKDYVQGQYCDQCKQTAFYLSPDNPHGCARCFCTGVTDQCGSSNLRRKTISTRFNSPQQRPVKIYGVHGVSTKYNDPKPTELQPQVYGGSLVLRDFDRSSQNTYYWSLPDNFNGDKVTSYGGYLTYTLRHLPSPGGQSSKNNAADVQLISLNGLAFNFFGNFAPSNDGYLNGSVQFLEKYWQRSDGKPVQRSDMLMALSDVETILVKATYTTNTEEAALVSVSIEIAEEGGNGPLALHVEQCRCPRGYLGTSCEDCAPGFTRVPDGIYLELCGPCECNGHSNQCHPETGVCFACQHNTDGDKCDKCAPGYNFDADNNCVPNTPPGPNEECRCDTRGTSGPCYYGRCQCKQNVEGDSCNQCRPGTFNLDENNPSGCTSCYCSGVTNSCQAASFWKRLAMPAPAISEQHGYTLMTIDADTVINSNFVMNQQMNQLGYIFGIYPPSNPHYWSLPVFPGNRITSYGGNLQITQKFESGDYIENSNPETNVVLVGGDQSIFWTNPQSIKSKEPLSYQVPLIEGDWVDLATSSPVTRDQFLQVLSELRRVLVLATLSPHITSTYISDVSMDTAIQSDDGQGGANDVELCSCPEGYSGSSCEQCSPGWYRDERRRCVPCPCNGRADSCQLAPNGQVFCNCKLPYTGRDCASVGDDSSTSTTLRPPPISTVTVQITKPLIEIVALGSTVNFTCAARSRAKQIPLTTTWSKAGGYLPLDRVVADQRGFLIITNVQVSDSGTYICQATDGISIGRDTVSFIVPPNSNSKPVVQIVPPYIDVYEGDLVRLECRTTGNPQPTISWVRSSNRAMPYASTLTESVFTIERARKADEGEYRCVATNALGSVESTAMVFVNRRAGQQVPAQLTIEPSQPNVQEGQNTQLVCSGPTDIPANTISWSRQDGYGLASNVRTNFGILYIESGTNENSGVYICQSSMPSISPVQVSLNVRLLVTTTSRPGDEPGLVLPVNTTTIPTGGSRTIDCIPQGYPLPLIKWKKYNEEFGRGVSQRGNSLVISNAEQSDGGYYICEAILQDGTPVTQAYLSVMIERREKPRVEIWPTGVVAVSLDSEFELRCRVTGGEPEPVVTWSRHGREMSVYTHVVPGNILHFSKITVNDEGEYICSASNIAGESLASTTITVQSTPQITITPQNYIQTQIGQPIKVDCRATGYPEPMVFWRKEKDRRELSPPTAGIASIRIPAASFQDEDDYTCIAQSAAGSSQEQIHIVVDSIEEGSGTDPGEIYEPPSRPDLNDLYTAVGTNIDIRCNVSDPDNNIVVKWSRADGYPLPPTNIQNGDTLTIVRATSRDSGIYQCSGVDRRTEGVRFASQTKLAVERKPKITLKPQSQTVRPGQYANVECVVEGDQPMTVTWQAASGELSPRAEIRSANLRFNRIEVEDAGIYVCVASNRVGQARSPAEVKVLEPVKPAGYVRIERPRGPETVGTNVTVNCRASSPDLSLNWERPGLPQYVDSKNFPGLSVLNLPSVSMADAGLYRCRGENQYQQLVTDEFTLEVQPAPEYPPRPFPLPTDKVYTAPLGSNISLPCTTDLAQPDVEWIREYGYLPKQVNPREPELRLEWVQESDAGTYICRVMNGNTAVESRVILKVSHVVPKFNRYSWLSLKPPTDVYSKLDIELSVKPQVNDGLILYNSENPGRTGDMIALRLVNGVPEFQYNAGSGVTTLQGDRPLELNKWHTIRISRTYQAITMYVDNNGPFMAESPGAKYQGLELKQPMYIGGVPDLTQLPDTLSDSFGLVGCVNMLIVSKEEISLMRDRLEDSGDLSECDSCTPNPCRNNGVCQDARNERGYTCLCTAGFAGHNCGRTGEACRPELCGPGKCHDTDDGYKCSCPIQFSGRRCELQQQIEYPAFTGSAYLGFEPPKGWRVFKLSMKIKAASQITNGIIMYCSESILGSGGFTSLAVRNGYLEFRFDMGDGNRPTVLRSQRPLSPNEWTDVVVGRFSEKVTMTVNKLDEVKGVLEQSGNKKELRWETPMYVGGYDDQAIVLNNKTEVTGGFNGCIKDLAVYGTRIDMVNSPINSANVKECSNFGPQRGDIPAELTTGAADTLVDCQCHNGGTCRLPQMTCDCPPGYTGTYCQYRESNADPCAAQPCQEGGTCRPTPQGYKCDCRLGFAGYHCQNAIRLQDKVQLSGDGFVELPADLLDHTRPGAPQSIALAIVSNRDGVLLYQHETRSNARAGDFLLLHIVRGFVVLEWNLGGGVGTVTSKVPINDGKRHLIYVELRDRSAILEVTDSREYGTAPGLSTVLNADSSIYLGGIPNNENWRGLHGFDGCIEQVEFPELLNIHGAVNIGQTAISGVNAQRCSG